MTSIKNLKSCCTQNNIFLMISGGIYKDSIPVIIEMTKSKINTFKEENPSVKGLVTILIEMLQNVVQYEKHNYNNDIDVQKDSMMIFALDEDKDLYYASTGNTININNLEKIKNSINLLNSLSRDELKDMYTSKRRSGADAHINGAGLGLITMAKISSEDIEFDIEIKSDTLAYLSLKIYQ